MNRLEILRKYGLIVEEVEPDVYKVKNTDVEVNVDRLKWEFEAVTLIRSPKIRYERSETFGATVIANVYYVIFITNDSNIAFKYEDICHEKYGIVSYDPYKRQGGCKDYIDTIYTKEEYEGLIGKCHHQDQK